MTASGGLRQFFSLPRVIALAACIPVAAGLDALGTFKKLDPLLSPFMAALTYVKSDDIVIVEVFDDDLPPHYSQDHILLADDLKNFVETVADACPAVIGVDLDTSHERFKALAAETFKPNPKHCSAGTPAPSTIPIIWARTSRWSARSGCYYVGNVLGEARPAFRNQLTSGDQAGAGKCPAGENQSSGADSRIDTDGSRRAGAPVLSALVKLPESESHDIREYERSFDTNVGPLWFLPCAVINFPHPPPDPPQYATYLPILYHQPPPEPIRLKDVPKQLWRFRNHKVLLGGRYQGYDELKTPIGWMQGVEVMAQIAEADGQTREKPSSILIVIIMFLFAVGTSAAFLWASRIALAIYSIGGACFASKSLYELYKLPSTSPDFLLGLFVFVTLAGAVAWNLRSSPVIWLKICCATTANLVLTSMFQELLRSASQSVYLFITLTVVTATEIRNYYVDSKKKQDEARLIEVIRSEVSSRFEKSFRTGADMDLLE